MWNPLSALYMALHAWSMRYGSGSGSGGSATSGTEAGGETHQYTKVQTGFERGYTPEYYEGTHYRKISTQPAETDAKGTQVTTSESPYSTGYRGTFRREQYALQAEIEGPTQVETQPVITTQPMTQAQSQGGVFSMGGGYYQEREPSGKVTADIWITDDYVHIVGGAFGQDQWFYKSENALKYQQRKDGILARVRN